MQLFGKIVRQRPSWITLTVAVSAFTTFSALAQTPKPSARSISQGVIPSGTGWFAIPDTQLAPHCPNPSPGGNSGCAGVILAWSGAIADTTANRMIIWGGGHQNYYGNEVYSLNLGTSPIAMTRLTNPSPFNNDCTDSQTDGNPTSRHTYNGLAFMPTVNKMYAYSGGKANCGYAGRDTWTFDLATLQWRRQDPTAGGPPAGCAGCVADYDRNTGLVFLVDLTALWSYNPQTNSYKQLQTLSDFDYHLTGVIDPGRQLFVLIGGKGQFWIINVGPKSKYSVQDWSQKVQGCEALKHAPYPGLAYDPGSKLIVGWAGGDAVISFNPDTRRCTTQIFPGGPGPAQETGTHGRFRYFPAVGAFVLVNDWKQDAFALRLASAPNPFASSAGGKP